MGDTEIEIQANVDPTDELLRFLRAKGRQGRKERQIDEYFTPENRNFTSVRPIREWLRIRTEQHRATLNYKNWHYDRKNRGTYADEFETEMGSTDQVKKLLLALRFKLLTVVDKTRTSWLYKDYEISLDRVKGLGNFVEIEYKGREAPKDPAVVTKEMVKFLKDHGCKKVLANHTGYPFLLLFPDEARYEEM